MPRIGDGGRLALLTECVKLDGEFGHLRDRAAPLDQFYLSTRYPNTLPGGIPAQAFLALVRRRLA